MAVNTHSTDLESGSSQAWYIPNASITGLNIAGSMTVSGWFKLESSPASGASYQMIAKWGSDGYQYNMQYWNNSGTFKLRCFTSSTSGEGSIVGGSLTQTLTTGTWYHIAWVYTAVTGSIQIYVNGSSIGTITGLSAALYALGTAAFIIGAEGNTPSSTYYDGLIDDVQVYSNNTVSISDLYNSPCNVSDSASGLQGRWRFDNNGEDSTSNNNDLINANTATFTTDVAYTCGSVNGNFLSFM
jgi:hypothetical protein